MTWYDLHRCVYDFIRAHESGGGESFDVSQYGLSPDERRAFEDHDVAGLYRLDLHGVLLNRYCRQIGLTRDDYRALLQPYAIPETRRGRWQS